MHRYVVLHIGNPDGSTYYDHCLTIYQQTGIWPKEYPRPEIPTAGIPIWDWFWQLRQASSPGYSGPVPLQFSEIDAWARLFGVALEPVGLRLLMILDQQYLSSWYEEKSKRDKNKR